MLLDGVWFDGEPFPRDSLSAYYYSGVRELFVGALSATGVFLLTYKVAERNLDNTLSLLAGARVLLVARLPDEPPGPRRAPDAAAGGARRDVRGDRPLRERRGVHLRARGDQLLLRQARGRAAAVEGRRSPRFWRNFHWACAGAIAAALLWILVTEVGDVGPGESLLIGEAVSVWAFGISWLWKGLEVDLLRGG